MKWMFWLVSIPFVVLAVVVLMVIGLIGTAGELVRRACAWLLKASEPIPRWYSRMIPGDPFERASRRRRS